MTKAFVVALYVYVALATAQTRAPGGNPRPESGKVWLDLDFATPRPRQVEELIRGSSLIVDGRVIDVLPSVRLKPSYPIETDSLVAVTEVLFGTMPAGADTIAVTQFGGKIGALEEVFGEDQMMASGERYIFFLHGDTGPSPPAENRPRYWPAGVWVGKAKVENGTISFPPKAYGIGLTRLNGSDIASFLPLIRQTISAYSQSHPQTSPNAGQASQQDSTGTEKK